ncbi:MAG: hypothetical protein ABSG98_09370 [Anaerolineales bacterium]|jgi:hypothetical protein
MVTTETNQKQGHQWVCEQIESCRQGYPRYAKTALGREQVLEKVSKQTSVLAKYPIRPTIVMAGCVPTKASTFWQVFAICLAMGLAKLDIVSSNP